MITRISIIFLLAMLWYLPSHAQKYTVLGNKTFGTVEREWRLSIVWKSDNEIILACNTTANIDGDKTDPNCDSAFNDFWLIKIDTAFNILLDKDIGGNKSETQAHLYWIPALGQLTLSGVSSSDSSCEKSENNRSYPNIGTDYWICMLDSNGNIIWEKTFGGDNGESGSQVIAFNNGSLLIGGSSQSQISGDKSVAPYSLNMDYWIIKLDSQGNKIWDRIYGGSDNEFNGSSQYDFCMIPETNDNIVISGTTSSPASFDITDSSRGQSDIWVIKIDSSGNKIWDKRFGGNDDDRSQHIIKSPDNGYIICGSTNSPKGLDVSDSSKGSSDCWLIKLDSTGNKQWDKRYGGNKFDSGVWIENAPGGGYWVSCNTNSDSSFDVSEKPYGSQDYWIFKIDSAGNKLFDKRFGGTKYSEFPRFVILPDSSIFLCGCADTGISTVKTDYGKGDKDIWCIHFKYEDTLSTTQIMNYKNQQDFVTVYPNPAKELLTIKLNGTEYEKGILTITDGNGKQVIARSIAKNEIEIKIKTTGWQSGVYLWKLEKLNKLPQQGKVTVIK